MHPNNVESLIELIKAECRKELAAAGGRASWAVLTQEERRAKARRLAEIRWQQAPRAGEKAQTTDG